MLAHISKFIICLFLDISMPCKYEEKNTRAMWSDDNL